MTSKLAAIVCLIFGLTLVACAREKEAAASPKSSDTSPPPAFNSARAMQYVKEIVALGPRPIGSANHKKVEDYIHAHLKVTTSKTMLSRSQRQKGSFPSTT